MAIIFSNYKDMPMNSGKNKNNWYLPIVKKMQLETDKTFVVKLTMDNYRIIDNDVFSNPSYNSMFTNKMYDYYCLKNNEKCPMVGEDAKEPITDLIKMIDLENSTNVWRYRKKRQYIINMVNYIIDENNKFWERLDSGDIDLIDDLKKSSGAEKDGPKSLASKICKYFCGLFFEKENYYINDTVVRHVLPYYLDYYGVEKPYKTKTGYEAMSYKELHLCLDKLKDKLNNGITREGMDHIMWYCYRYDSLDE